MTQKIYICAARRTPMGSFQGNLAPVSAAQLGAAVISEILASSGLEGKQVDDVILGSVLTAGQGQAPARQAMIAAGLPISTQALTVNKVCSSGLKAVMLAAGKIELGEADCIVAGGMENMSQAPFLLPSLRTGARLGNAEAVDSLIHDGLWDPYNDQHMGNCAELCAEKYKLTREAQDNFALESYRRANEAISSGKFKDEIVPVTVKSRRGESIVDEDEEPGKLKVDKVPELRPAFKKDGTVTAANASSINDGAAALLVCSEKFVAANKLTPLASIESRGWHACEPEWFTTAPVSALKMALDKAGKKVDQIDLFEVNEAFSAVALACMSELEIDHKKLNVNGGAVALGHPIGASGARILVTLLHALKNKKAKHGAVGICNGGGEATSLVVELV